MHYVTIIPLALVVLPWVIARYILPTTKTRSLPYRDHAVYLWVAAGLSVASQLVPVIPISPETDTFSMHMTGGAMAAVLFAYFMAVYKVRFAAPWYQWVALYFFVSGMGVLNELMEFVLYKLHLMDIAPGDEWWDLVANTVGGALAYAVVVLTRRR